MEKHFRKVPLAIAIALSLTSCAPTGKELRSAAGPAAPDTATAPSAALVETPPGTPAAASARDADAQRGRERRPFAEIFRGNGGFVGAQPMQRSAAIDSAGDFSMNFVNADVRDVAKAVLGDLLKLNYVIDPGVQGPITIQTSQPVSQAEVMPALETALRLSGIALVKSPDGFYRLLPIANAPRQNGTLEVESRQVATQAGFGVEILPLRYISVPEMQRLLEPLVPTGSIQEVDTARNLLVIAGTRQERATMREDIALFDVDWLKGMSFAFFTPQSTDAKSLAKDLSQVIGGPDSPMSGLVRLIPIERQNAVLAISPQPQYLDELAQWAQRLDRPGETTDRRIFVYHVQHGRAADLASVLTKVLTGNGDTDTGGRSIRPGDTADAMIQKPLLPGYAAPGTGGGALVPPVAPGPLAQGPPKASLAGLPPLPGAAGGDEGISLGEGAGAHITADEINNALLIMASPREYAVIEAALHELDVVPLEVLLEAAIAEVTLTSELRYGVQYFVQKGKNQALLTDTATPIAPSLPGFAYSFASANIQVILSALEDATEVDVISAPEVLVLNNQTAILQVGDQVPIATQSAVSVVAGGAPVVNTIEYRDTGVTLKVTPRVNQGGMVMMDISQEVSDVAATTTSTLDSPTINQRKISSTVAVHDGQTIALGGLISDNRTKSKSGIPVLQNIPVLGSLFATTDHQDSRTELLVLITPHVVENAQKAQSVTEELRRKLPMTRQLFPRPN